jgi:hypothetical protein
VKLSDAPRSGWYPDPHDPRQLRWWDGSDWTEARRARPTTYEQAGVAAAASSTVAGLDELRSAPTSAPRLSRQDTEFIVTEVRQAARAEIERASQQLTARAAAATRQFQPLVTEYTNRFVRLLKILIALVLLLFVAWVVFQVVAQASFFEWLGDRIDNITDDVNDE